MKKFTILLILVIGFVICLLYLNNYTYLGMPHIPTNEENIEQKIKNWENYTKFEFLLFFFHIYLKGKRLQTLNNL